MSAWVSKVILKPLPHLQRYFSGQKIIYYKSRLTEGHFRSQ